MSPFVIREFKSSDIGSIIKIERDSFSTPWSERAFIRELGNEYAYYLVLEVDEGIIGYIGGWLVLDECHITTLAIDRDHRCIGVATKLLRRFLLDVKEVGIKRATLEVRASNRKALGLYLKEDFKKFGIRKNYYSDNNEDAVIMWKEIT